MATTLAHALDRTLYPIFKKHGFVESRIVTDWGQIVGHRNAALTTPLKIVFPPSKRTEGVLHVEVYSSFATVFQHLEPMILEKLASYFGYKAVTQLRLIHTMQLPETTVRPLALTPPLPLSSEARAKLESALSGIEDAPLAGVLRSLGEVILRGV